MELAPKSLTTSKMKPTIKKKILIFWSQNFPGLDFDFDLDIKFRSTNQNDLENGV